MTRYTYLLAAISSLMVTSCVQPVDPATRPLTSNVEDWRDEVIYQVVTDRFSDGDYSNNFNVNVSDPSAYHGGDWRGIQNKLDYLVELGVTAIWISPVVKNVESDAGFSSYHGYWTQDFSRPNPHFGDVIALREMVDAAHEHGIKVILDIVTNHVGQAFFYDVNKNGQPDEIHIGQGAPVGYPIDQEDPTSEFIRITEWDPDFSISGVQSWTSLGPSGPAPIEFVNDPAINRVAPQPAIFAEPWAYNRRGRVTVWTHPESCQCATNDQCTWQGVEHCELAELSLGQGVCSCDYTTGSCTWADDQACLRAQEILGDFPGGLKDIATTRQDVRDALFEVFRDWIDIGDFDGFRIDTLKHVEQSFWEDFCPRIRAYAKSRGKDNFLMFGEAFDGSDDLLGSYTHGEGVDSVFYFSQYYWIFRNRLLGDGARTCEIERLHCQRLGCDADPCGEGGAIEARYSAVGKTDGVATTDGTGLNSQQLIVNFSENHDVGRFLYFMPDTWSETEKRTVLHLGLTYLLTSEGIPSLYYGVEQEFSGGNDPANRETFWNPAFYEREVSGSDGWLSESKRYDSNDDGEPDTLWQPFDTGNPTFLMLKELIALRHAHVSLRRGSMIPRWSTRSSGGTDHGIFAFERQHPDETALVILNLASGRASTTSISESTMPVSFAPGTALVDALDSSSSWTVSAAGCTAPQGGGCVDVTIPPRSARILLTQ